ncbi:MAG: aminotransferase class I/II-fold pyridoxal phosphate-dependent enzyme [Spirochaetaceae bacterium]|nr:MAG: aminotransferase class I/II-fold pyridoxal phosphate-dependent enzyme [Spirochaetaceae bacterium]
MPAKNSVFEKIGKTFTSEKISQRVRGMAVSAIKEMSLLAMEIPDSVNLAWGLPSFETPLPIRKRIADELLTNPTIGKYAPPPGLPELKSKIAARLKEQKGIVVDPQKQIIITAGGMQALMMAWMTVLEPGDEVLIASPGFSSHYEQVYLAGGVPVAVPLLEEQDWRVDITAYRRAVTKKTKALVLVNPANPTGSVISEADLRAIGKLALEHGLFVITDDPYEVYVYDDLELFHMLRLPELSRQVIACASFSKEFAMTGWRVGWILAEEGITNQMLKVQDSFVICAPTISQVASLIALEESYEPTLQMVEEMKQRREIICSRLDNLSDLFSYQKPQGAYYIFPKILPEDLRNSVDFCVRLLKESGVVTVPGSAFGPTGEGHVRMSYCFTRQEIHEAFDRIEKWWARVRG